jgi:hypothetical protein
MLLAVAFAAPGLFGLQVVGVGRTVILPTSLIAKEGVFFRKYRYYFIDTLHKVELE